MVSLYRFSHAFIFAGILRKIDVSLLKNNSRYFSVLAAAATANTEASASRKTQRVLKVDKASSLHYCMESVKKSDYENFLCSLLLPSPLSTTAFAIRAFNVELAQIQDITADALIAHMRFQFWKDTLEKIYSGSPAPASPIAQELHQAIYTSKLSRLWFTRLIDARLDRIHGKPFPSTDSVEIYSENSVSPIFYLLLESANVKSVPADHAASHIGKAIGLTNLIRSVPFLVSRGQVTLPMDLLAKFSLSSEVISRIARGVERRSGIPVTESDVTALKDVVFELAGRADFHVEKARNLLKDVPTGSFSIYLPVVPCVVFLNRLRRADFDVFAGGLRQRDGWLPLRLWWKSKRKEF